MWNINAPQGHIPSTKIWRVCTPFQDALAVKMWLDLLEELWSYGGFKLRLSGYPQIFSTPCGMKNLSLLFINRYGFLSFNSSQNNYICHIHFKKIILTTAVM